MSQTATKWNRLGFWGKGQNIWVWLVQSMNDRRYFGQCYSFSSPSTLREQVLNTVTARGRACVKMKWGFKEPWLRARSSIFLGNKLNIFISVWEYSRAWLRLKPAGKTCCWLGHGIVKTLWLSIRTQKGTGRGAEARHLSAAALFQLITEDNRTVPQQHHGIPTPRFPLLTSNCTWG